MVGFTCADAERGTLVGVANRRVLGARSGLLQPSRQMRFLRLPSLLFHPCHLLAWAGL